MSTLLEQAIVDAKALRETAMKNAEASVIEKYSKEVEAAVSSILEQQDPFAEIAGMPPTAAMAPMTPEDPASTPTEGKKEELNAIAEQLPDAFLGENDTPVVINLEEIESGLNDALTEQGIDPFEDIDEELDLEDLYKEDDIQEMAWGDLEEGDAMSSFEDAISDSYMGEGDMSEFTNESDPGADEGIYSEYEADEGIYEDALTFDEQLNEEVRFHGFDNPEASGYPHLPEEITREIEELRAIAKELQDEKEEINQEKETIKKENKSLKTAGQEVLQNNKELRSAVDNLREKVEMTNISNAKLLYINQTLGNASLNERQKEKIVENISRADSVQEAKTIYETLQSTVGTQAKEPLPQSLSEAVSRRSSSLLISASQRKVESTNIHSPFFERMQTLAGIKKT